MAVSAFLAVAQAIVDDLAAMPPAAAALAADLQHLQRSAAAAIARDDFAGVPAGDRAATLAAALRCCGDHGPRRIAQSLAALPAALPWHYHYQPRAGEPDLAERIAFAELIGPDAPLLAPDCRIGFTLMAPETFYPLHAHPAVELYFVIAGTAQWTTPDADRRVPPGRFVLHRSNEPHAMRTFATPLLALYSWRGDLDTSAYYCDRVA